MSNCTIDSTLEGDGDKAPLVKLIFSEATFVNKAEVFSYIKTSFLSLLDVSNSSLNQFCVLADMKMLEHLNLSSTVMGDDSVELIVCIGASLKSLNLSGTRISFAGIRILAGHIPKLETLCLSHTSIDDAALSYISLMPSLKAIDLSNTDVGFNYQPGIDSTLTALQNLSYLESVNLEYTLVSDEGLYPLSSCRELSQLSLNSSYFLSDATLHLLSSLPKLTNLRIREAMLTNSGLDAFSPPTTLRVLDLMGCWLLTEDAISSFLRKHPRVEVRHEVVQNLSTEQQNVSHCPSLSQQSLKTSQGNKMQGDYTFFFCLFSETGHTLKCNREELLALQFSRLSLESPEFY